MEYRNLGNSGLQVSLVGIGCNNFGGRIDIDATHAVIDKAIDVGGDDLRVGVVGADHPLLGIGDGVGFDEESPDIGSDRIEGIVGTRVGVKQDQFALDRVPDDAFSDCQLHGGSFLLVPRSHLYRIYTLFYVRIVALTEVYPSSNYFYQQEYGYFFVRAASQRYSWRTAFSRPRPTAERGELSLNASAMA